MKLSYGKRSMMTSCFWHSPNRTELGHKSATVPFVNWLKSPHIKGLSIFILTIYSDNFRTLLTLLSVKNYAQSSWNSSFSHGRFSCLRNNEVRFLSDFFCCFLSTAQKFHDTSHLVRNPDLLRTLGKTLLAVLTATSPFLYIGQCFP